jgi:hypothetical protein
MSKDAKRRSRKRRKESHPENASFIDFEELKEQSQAVQNQVVRPSSWKLYEPRMEDLASWCLSCELGYDPRQRVLVNTPEHIKLFIQWYCQTNNCNYPSAEQIRSGVDEITGYGNPCDSKILTNYVLGLKRSYKTGKNSKRSLPLLYQHMEILHTFQSSLRDESVLRRSTILY